MIIKQPKDMNINGSLKFKWNKQFGSLTTEKLNRTQKLIDSECIRLIKPYTPFRNGFLERSATLGTVIGSGKIQQISPYARYLYYGEVYGPNFPIKENGIVIGWYSIPKMKKHPTGRNLKYDTSKHPQAGKMWFERMKADRKDEILRGAAAIAGGKPK